MSDEINFNEIKYIDDSEINYYNNENEYYTNEIKINGEIYISIQIQL